MTAQQEFYVNINLMGNEIKDFVVDKLTSAPTGAVGRLYYNTSSNKMFFYNGTSWTEVGGGEAISDLQTRVGNLETTVGSSTSGLVKDVADLKTGKISTGQGKAGTYTKVTVSSDGIVTDGQGQIACADISDIATTYLGIDATAKSAEKLSASKNFSIAGGATASAVAFDGTGDVELSVTALDADKISAGTVGISYLPTESTLSTSATVVPLSSAVSTALGEKLDKSDVVASYTETTTGKALDATKGKDLDERIKNLEALGRYLSQWDSTTGKPTTEPATKPYDYKTGDYFIVCKVGTTNYKPTGTQYTGTASTTAETETVNVGDFYLYDGNGTWKLQPNQRHDVITDVKVGDSSVVTGSVATIEYASSIASGAYQAPQSGAVYTALEGKINTSDIDTTSFSTSTSKVPASQLVSTELAKKVDTNPNITGATKCKITYDAKGLVTAGADLVASDIPDIGISQVTGLQTELNAKLAKNADITAGTKCKITYDKSGLVTAGEDLSATDIPEIPQSKVTDLVTDLAKKFEKDNIDTTALSASDAKVPSSQLVSTELAKKVTAETGKGLSTNDYTTDEKTKLAGIESGAQVNVIEEVQLNGTALPVTSKAVNVATPVFKTATLGFTSGVATVPATTGFAIALAEVVKSTGEAIMANILYLESSVQVSMNPASGATYTLRYIEYPSGTTA